MARLIFTNKDLSGRTIKGQPFSYIGRCTGTDIKFVGDWTNLSYFQNNFVRPDFSRAQTRWSYGRFNTFVDPQTSRDIEMSDPDTLKAAIDESMSRLTAEGRWATALAYEEATAADRLVVPDIQEGSYTVSWANGIPLLLRNLGGDVEKLMEVLKAIADGRPHVVDHCFKQHDADPSQAVWDDSEEPTRNIEGITVTDWGVLACNREGKEYRKRWSALPSPTNPHDRVEVAELIEAEILATIGLRVTFWIRNILPWRAYACTGIHGRDWFTREAVR